MKIKHDFFYYCHSVCSCFMCVGIAVFSVWLILCVVDGFHSRSCYVM